MPRSQRLQSLSFRVGRVRGYLRGRVWYLCYREDGRRRQPRVGPDRDLARQVAAEINAQLEVALPSTLGFEPISVVELRERGLSHHEHVRRSSQHTIRRYRSATQHLLNFVERVRPVRRALDLRPSWNDEFASTSRLPQLCDGTPGGGILGFRTRMLRFTCCSPCSRMRT